VEINEIKNDEGKEKINKRTRSLEKLFPKHNRNYDKKTKKKAT
jgi:hypothetical protein